MHLIVNDLPQHGVVIHGPASAGFSNKLWALVTVPDDLSGDAMRYSVIVENKTPQHIIAMSVVWRFYPSNGEPIMQSYSFSFMGNSVFNNVAESLIKPGEQYPLSLLLDSVGFGRQRAQVIKSDGQTKQRLERVNAQIARSVKWSVEIDGVLFSNGVCVGPNTTKYLDLLDARIRGARDMVNELANRLDAGEPAADVLAHARSFAEITDEQLEAPFPDFRERMHNPELAYNQAKTGMARQAVARDKNFGGERAMIEWIRENSRMHILLVKREPSAKL